MKTRSQTTYDKSCPFVVEIDFDGASQAWKANKRSLGYGHYEYIEEEELQIDTSRRYPSRKRKPIKK